MKDIITEKNAISAGTLYLVATPIGNLSDISERALKTLSEVDFVAAEDTRNSRKLLSCFGISKPMISYFEHNKKARGEEIVARLSSGESCALVTDAGMPGISDPGEDIVRLCIENGIPVTLIPGPCAAVTALVLSGLPTAKFIFEGFLPQKASERDKRIEELSRETRTIVLYEAPHRLKSTLKSLGKGFGDDRKLSICRELTKINEEIFRTTIAQACDYYSGNDPRGEYVLIVAGADETKSELSPALSDPVAEVKSLILAGFPKNEAIKQVARQLGVPKNTVYQQFISSTEGENGNAQ